MVLIDSLRLLVGLAFLGVIIALGLWLLSRLFPEIPNTPEYMQDNATQTQQANARTKHKQSESSGVMHEHSRQNSDERILR